MKIAVCCIVKQENLYLRDWVKYYHDMGITKIVLYDNNDVNGEYPQQVIGDYIASGFVDYKNARGKYRHQIEAYNQCYKEYKHEFDWIGFLDIDEYWYLSPEYTIDTFFSEERLPNAYAVFINWLCYGDDNKIHYEPKPMQERFKTPTYPLDFADKNGSVVNKVKKMFLKCSDKVDFTIDEVDDVTFYTDIGEIKAYMANGEIYDYNKITYDISVIKHYRTLTIEEFLYRRFGRGGYADITSSFNYDVVMNVFWSQNEWTQEKQNIIDEFFKNFKIIEDNVIKK
jgi:hypothetical protein